MAMPDAIARPRPLAWRALADAWLPLIVLAAMLAAIGMLRPGVFGMFGLNLLFKLSVPLILAALSQMLVVALGDIDLSTGAFIGFVTCVCAVHLDAEPLTAAALLLAGIGAYALVGALIQLRRLPSIIVTLGTSFVWTGCAVLVLPAPGGVAPAWLTAIPRLSMPLLPLPLWIAAGLALVGHLVVMKSSLGVLVRGAGGNPRAMTRAGWSVLRLRVGIYAAAGACNVAAGLALSALTTSGAPNIAPAYTLLSIAAVILGGGSFVGGIVSPAGTVVGAMTLSLVGSVLTFLSVPPVWQIGAQGLILVAVLFGRVLTRGRA
ncbi:ribose transport system permease protein [Labrys wisconsinensis]|uniref:Ribose transport system permease protein n=2 Tax=Labrys wisconsinensis TaxID=425677 RepID=A0ABU0JG36_9HYPH|nr:ABC transporter permease [Labrys wisconsinensis]MDQ0473259.1 ribose transport system permease protein [Labrys wisconsinensis]